VEEAVLRIVDPDVVITARLAEALEAFVERALGRDLLKLQDEIRRQRPVRDLVK
jgi:hypothetical protein